MFKNNLTKLFTPESIAIVGASNKKGKVGTVITENILKLGYQGKIYLVNPAYKILKLKRCYGSLNEIKKPVDVAIVAVPAKFVAAVIRESCQSVKNFVIISAGFSEIGAAGVKLEQEIAELAKKHTLNILGPNCLGFIVPQLKLNASFAGGMPESGNIAFVSQSGALAVALMDRARIENLAFSHVISVGNKMQLDEAVLLEYLGRDSQTKVIGMYLEGIKDGKKFVQVAKKISKLKPIVILKAGKTAKAQLAISSHTGALAGSDEIMDVAFEKAGVIRARDLEEFFDLLTTISFLPTPKNTQTAVVTNAGGAGVLTTDAFKGKEIVLADFPEKLKIALRKTLPAESSVENPVDLLGDAREDRYRNTLDLLQQTKIGTLISVLTPQEQTPVAEITDVIIEAREKQDANVISIFIGGDKVKKAIERLREKRIPNFSNPDNAVRALNKYFQWSEFKAKKSAVLAASHNTANEKEQEVKIFSERKKEVEKIIKEALLKKQKALLFSDAAKVMQKYGIDSIETWSFGAKAELPVISTFPVAVKIDSDTVLHKSDKQALILNLKHPKELEAAVQKLRANFPTEQLVIQKMQDKQVEIILGIKLDAIFGPVIVYGLGGIYTEVFRMVNFLLPPMTLAQIKEQVLKSKISFLFTETRGQKAYDLDEFAKILQGLMEFSQEIKKVREFDINPFFIYNDKRKAVAVDIKIIF